VDIGIFEKNDYHKHKKELDTIHISNLFFQLKTIKMTIIRVMEEITAGNTHPRLIEVMGQLQDKMAAITKMQANYMLFLEETYRKLNEPSQNPNDVNLPNNPEEGQFFVSVGTKNVIKNLPDAKGATENSSTRLTDPSSKADLMKERNVQIEKDPEDDDFIDLTEII
jgi:chaperonin cofactor prefoldin